MTKLQDAVAAYMEKNAVKGHVKFVNGRWVSPAQVRADEKIAREVAVSVRKMAKRGTFDDAEIQAAVNAVVEAM